MCKTDIHIGDIVRIRQWDDMRSEYGLNQNGNIKCAKIFAQGMLHMCGTEFVVSGLWTEGQNLIIRGFPFIPSERHWTVSSDMVEPVYDLQCNIDSLEDIL